MPTFTFESKQNVTYRENESKQNVTYRENEILLCVFLPKSTFESNENHFILVPSQAAKIDF